MLFYYNGELITGNTLNFNINEPSLLYGATVFTTLRVYEQSLEHPLTHWVDHCQRLKNSLEVFGWSFPDWELLKKETEILTQTYPIIRITIFPDGREWITGRFLPEDLSQRQSQGIKGWIAEDNLYKRSLPEHKTGNYLTPWLARQQAEKMGAKEAILTNNQGDWLETNTGNLWGWKGKTIFTPHQEILPGIARKNLLIWLKQQNILVQETQWNIDFVQELEGVAYSNSVVQIVPFNEIIAENFSRCYNASHYCLEQIQKYYDVESVFPRF